MSPIQINSLRRTRGRPRPWHVRLAGSDDEIEVGTRTLLSAAAFRRRALLSLGRLPPPMTDEAWLRLLGGALARVKVDEA